MQFKTDLLCIVKLLLLRRDTYSAYTPFFFFLTVLATTYTWNVIFEFSDIEKFELPYLLYFNEGNLSKLIYFHILFRCCFCRQKVKTQPSLRSHILRHLKNGSIRKCRYCDFMTAVTQTLHEHEWKHTNWRPYKCPNCPFRCRLKSDLGKHRATHSYYKKFSCHLCSYRTKWRSSLTYHLDRHSDVRTLPHACRQVRRQYFYLLHDDYSWGCNNNRCGFIKSSMKGS